MGTVSVPFKIISREEFEVIYDFLKPNGFAEMQNTIEKPDFISHGKHCLPQFKSKGEKTQERNLHL